MSSLEQNRRFEPPADPLHGCATVRKFDVPLDLERETLGRMVSDEQLHAANGGAEDTCYGCNR